MWTLHTDSGNAATGGQTAKNIYLGDTRIVTKLNSPDSRATYSEEYHKQYYYHSDHLGSASLISDYEGYEYQRLEYTPYGEIWVEKTQNTGSAYLPYKFTGKEMDEETGLYYYGARYLDPKYSRWLSTDPALGEYIPSAPINDEAKKNNKNLPGMGGVFNPINFHLYHYVGNNPVRYVDPDGRTAKNATNQYIIVRLESDNEPCHYIILAPGDFITANCDGAIFSSSNMIKVSAEESWGDVVNFTILGEYSFGAIAYIDDLKSAWINTSRDYIKYLYNVSRLAKNLIHSLTDKKYDSFKDFSGSYRKQSTEGEPLNDWWKGITSPEKANLGATQENWKTKYETNPVQKELQQKYLERREK